MNRQELFDHMIDEHDLTLVESELREIELIVLRENKKLNKTGWFSLGFSIALILIVILLEIL